MIDRTGGGGGPAPISTTATQPTPAPTPAAAGSTSAAGASSATPAAGDRIASAGGALPTDLLAHVAQTGLPAPSSADAGSSPLPVGSVAGSLAGRDMATVRGVHATTLDGAARDGLRRANPKSITDNLEYGGLLYQDPSSGRYRATAPLKGSPTGFDPSKAKIPAGSKMAGDYHTHGDYSRAGNNGTAIRTGSPKQDDFNSDHFSNQDYRGIAADARNRPGYAGYLGTPGNKNLKFDPATGETTSLHPTAHALAGGALTGAISGAAATAGDAIVHGHFTRDDLRATAENGALGAGLGAAQTQIERSATSGLDRVAGNTIERIASSGLGDEAGALARTAATRFGGSTIAGAAVSIGVSAFENRDGLIHGNSQAIGNVAGDAVVGAGSALAGAAAGAAIGSVVPVAGTLVGAGVGLVAGYAANEVMRAGGVGDFVSHEVSDGVNALKSFFGGL